MKAVLALEDAALVPDHVFSKKCFHLRLPNGQVVGTVSESEDVDDRQRDHLVGVRSHVRQAARWRLARYKLPPSSTVRCTTTLVVLLYSEPQAFAYLKCDKSSAYRGGTSGLVEKRRNTEFFTSSGGSSRYVNVLSIDAVVVILFVVESTLSCSREGVSHRENMKCFSHSRYEVTGAPLLRSLVYKSVEGELNRERKMIGVREMGGGIRGGAAVQPQTEQLSLDWKQSVRIYSFRHPRVWSIFLAEAPVFVVQRRRCRVVAPRAVPYHSRCRRLLLKSLIPATMPPRRRSPSESRGSDRQPVSRIGT